MNKLTYPKELLDSFQKLSDDCIECNLCMKECIMLNDFCSTPKELFKGFVETGEVNPIIPYSCNMCNQCTIVCPKKLQIGNSFMDIREEMVNKNNGKSPIKGHAAVDMHQTLSFSKIFNTIKSAKKYKRRQLIDGLYENY
jgi:glutamate synthase (NADPH/NADH) small chain